MSKYHFITFATPDHWIFAQNNVRSALNIGKFDTTQIYSMDDIDEEFKLKNANIFKDKTGSGFWLWKSYIIFKKLLEINENDILCYNDSKYIWTTDVRKLEKDILTNNHIGGYINRPNGHTHVEKQWSKSDAYILMNIPNNEVGYNIINSPQFWGGFVLLRKQFKSIRFVGEWLTYAQDDRIITDNPSYITQNDKTFRGNRHDQTIFSLLCKKWNVPMIMFDKNDLIDIRNPIPDLFNKSYKIVVARYNENISWLRNEMKNCIIYNKGEKLNIENEIILKDVGRESGTYLQYIISNYNNLPDIIVFTQARISDHKGSDDTNYLIRLKNEALHYSKSQNYMVHNDVGNCRSFDKEWNLQNGEYFLKDNYKNNEPKLFIDWFKENIKPEYPNPINVYDCGLFAVKKELILNNPIEYYEKLILEVNHHINSSEGHFFERSWYYIFS
jgi:hypothetical protein